MRSILLAVALTVLGGDTTALPLAEDARSEFGNLKASKIAVAIKVREADVDGKKRVLVDFEFTNTGRTRKRFERWLALDPAEVTTALLRVRKPDGSLIKYVGMHVNRRPPADKDFVTLESGERRIVEHVDVTTVYEWPGIATKLSVKYLALSGPTLEIVQSSAEILDFVP